MKRLLWSRMLMGLLLVTLLLGCAGCGETAVLTPPAQNTPSTEPAKTLSLWYWSILRPDLETDLYRGLVDDWNAANPNVRVEASAFDIEEYRSKIKTSLAAGEAPDLFYMWSGSFVRPYLKTGNMLPLDDYLPQDIRTRIKPGLLEQCMVDGKTYSLPIYTFTANLYCNTTLFAQAGAEIPKTYEELLIAVKALRNKGITPIALGEKDRWPGMYWYDILAMRTAGAASTRNALRYPTLFEREEFRQAADMLLELNALDAFSHEAFSLGFVEMVDSFRNGEAAMMYQGDWVAALVDAEESPVHNQVEVVPFPVVGGGAGSAYEFLGGNLDSFYIRADTSHPKEAVDMLLYISERAGKEGEIAGAGISCWVTDPTMQDQIPRLTAQSIALMETGRDYLGWWDTLLPASSADTHKSLVADLLDNRITSDEFAAEMAKLIGMQP